MSKKFNSSVYLDNYYNSLTELVNEHKSNDKIIKLSKFISNIKNNNKKIIVFGNGGSAAIVNHFTVDITKMFKVKCINLNESSIITCFSNDFGFDNWVKEAINHYADKNDLVIIISSSGMSMNMVNGAKKAIQKKCKLVTFSGFKKNNKLRKIGHINIWVKSNTYNFVENLHQIYLLSVVDLLLKTKI